MSRKRQGPAGLAGAGSAHLPRIELDDPAKLNQTQGRLIDARLGRVRVVEYWLEERSGRCARSGKLLREACVGVALGMLRLAGVPCV